MSDWQQRRSAERQQRRFRNITQALHWRKRFDGIWVLFVLLALATLIGSWWFGVQIAERLGMFDDPVLQQLDDERRQVGRNIYDTLPEQPLLDAIFHAPERLVYISQEGGTLHTYDPGTRLWGQERTGFTSSDPIDSDFVQLRSGCGADALSEFAAQCAEPDVLWGVGADGSLARRENNRWQIVISNSRFVGADGELVETDQLTTAAVSADSQWLLLGTRNNGVGLYNIQTHTWTRLGDLAQAALPSLAISHIVWWDGSFWVGSADGLGQLTPTDGQPVVELVEDVAGTIVDLAADDGLWVLERRDCLETEGACLWLGRLDSPNANPTVLINQQNFYPQVNLADLHYARQWGDTLALAGRVGIFIYDTDQHSWQQIFEEPVFATLAAEEAFYFSSGNVVQRVSADGTVDRDWTLAAPVQHLLYDSEDRLLAFTAAGGLYRLSGDDSVSKIYAPEQTAFAPDSFRSATTIDNTVLFIGTDGALLHDTVQRSYADLGSDLLPDWMKNEDTRLIGVGDFVYGLTMQGDRLAIYVAAADSMIDPDFYINREIRAIEPVTVPGPAQAVWQWGTSGIGILAADGDVYQVGTDVARLTESAESDLAQLHDVAQSGDNFYVAIEDTIRNYDLQGHDWETLATHDEGIAEIQIIDGQLVWRSDAARLLTLEGDVLIGDVNGFVSADSDLSDGMAVGDATYLAGDGRVERYDGAARQIGQRWEMAAGGDVLLLDVIDGRPLTQVGERAYLGENALLPDQGSVVTVSADSDTIWTVRERSGQRYLMGHDQDNVNTTTCYFRNPSAGGAVSTVHDALELPNGNIVVATNAGVRFYSPTARSWYAAADGALVANRLHIIDERLLLVAGDELGTRFDFAFVPLGNIQLPASCADGTVGLSAETITARAIASSDERAAWITQTGTVIEWQDGTTTTILAASDDAPSRSELRRLFDRQRYWLFTTTNELWRYDTQLRYWEQVTLNGVSGGIRDINIEQTGGENTLLVTTDAGFFIGTFDTEADSVSVSLIEYDTETAGFSGANLLDVQRRTRSEETWTFVLNDRVRYFDPVERSWQSSATQPSDRSRTFEEVLGRGVLVSGDRQRWHVATTQGAHPTSFATYNLTSSDQAIGLDNDAAIYRLTAAGELLRCEADGESYACESIYQPFVIDQVQQAFEFDGHLLMRTANGFRAFNSSNGTETPLPDALATLGNVTATYRDDRQLIVYSASQQRFVRIRAGLETREFFADQFFTDANGTLWMRDDNGWRWFDGADFNVIQDTPRPLLLPRSTPSAIGADGVPYRWTGNQFTAGLVLPAEFRSAEIRWLQSTNNTDWWVLQGSRLSYVALSNCVLPTPVPTPSPVITDTQTLTPEPTATPVLVPCYQTTDGVDLSIGQLAGVVAEGETITLIPTSGTAVRVDRQLVVSDSNATVAPMPVEDVWSQRSQNMVTLPNGQRAYDPFVDLLVGGGELLARRQSGGAGRLATTGALPNDFTLPDALDANWLRWQRTDERFVVRTPGGDVEYGSAEFIQNNALLFEPIDALLAKSTGEIYAANRFGVWQHGQTNLALNDDAIRFTPQTLDTPIVAVHGQLLAGSQAFAVASSGLTAQAPQNVSVSVGDVTLREQIAQPSVNGTVAISGSNDNAFAATGFVWDAARRGVAYVGNGDLLLQSDAGIQPARELLRDFDAAPNGLGRSNGILLDEANNAYLFAGDVWRRWQSVGSWQTVGQDPLQNRALVNNATWDWQLNNGVLGIQLQGNAHQFSFSVANFGFSSDRLQAAAAFDDQLFVMTDAFFESDPPNQLVNLQADRQPPVNSDAFWNVPFANGQRRLFRYDAGNISEWDQTTFRGFTGADPLGNRPIITTDRLRFTLNNGTVTKELNLDTFNGNDNWVRFNFVNRQFPFDVVTMLAEFDGDLYVGSAAGLQQYTSSSTGLDDLQTLFDLRDGAAQLVGVTRLGIPEQATDQLFVQTASDCWARQASTPFAPCEDASLLARRLRVLHPFWRWVDASGSLVGQYGLGTGSFSADSITITDDRFPHDHLAEVIVCDGQLLTRWQDGWLSAYDGTDLQIDTQTRNYAVAAERFICVDRDISLVSGETFGQGAYYEDSAANVLRYVNDRWLTVDDETLTLALKDFADFPLVMLEDRYRLRTPRDESPLTFEWRTVQRDWQPLTWVQDEATEGWYVPTDNWQYAHFVQDQLWAATDAGLVTFDYNNAALLNRNELVIVREPASPCRVTDMQTVGDDSWLRCDAASSRVYSGTLTTAQDRNVFTLSERDLFAEYPVTQADYWDWRVVERSDGNVGSLAATWQEEAVQLLTGQFDFDGVNSLALFEDEIVDVATDLGGWYRLPRASAHVGEFGRSDLIRQPKSVVQVRRTVADDEPRLCLRDNDGFQRIAPDETVDSAAQCPAYAGFDGLWQYETDGGQLFSFAPAGIGGRGARNLSAGRFADDRAVGLPIPQTISETVRYFLPSAAGVLEMDETLTTERIHVPPFAGLPADVAPTALWLAADATAPVYAGLSSLHTLDSNGLRDPLTGSLDELVGTEILSIEDGPQQLVRVNWRQAGANGWTLIERDTLDDDSFTRYENSLFIDLQPFSRFTQQRVAWENPEAWMGVTMQPRDVQVYFSGGEIAEERLPEGFALIRPIQYDERLLLIGRTDLQVVDLETAMLESFPENIATLPATRPFNPTVIGSTIQLADLAPVHQDYYAELELMQGEEGQRGGLYALVAQMALLPGFDFGADSPLMDGIRRDASQINQLVSPSDQLRVGIFFAEQGLRISREIDNPALTAYTLSLLSLGYAQQGQLPEANKAFNQARQFAEQYAPEMLGFVISNGVGIPLAEDDYVGAIELIDEGIAVAQMNDDRSQEIGLYVIKGQVHMTERRAQDAIIAYERAVAIQRETDNLEQLATTLTALGFAYQVLNDQENAQSIFTDALAAARAQGDCQLEGLTLNNVAYALQDALPLTNVAAAELDPALLENLDLAVAYSTEAIEKFTTQRASCLTEGMREDYIDDLIGILHSTKGFVQARRGDYEEAIATYQVGLPYVERAVADGSSATVLLNNYFNTLVTMDEPRSADARALIEADGDGGWQFKAASQPFVTDINLGLLATLEGDHASAIQFFTDAVTAYENTRENVSAEQLQVAYADAYVDVHERLFLLHWQIGQQEAAFAVAERARARAFLDQLANRNVADYQSGDAAHLFRELDVLYAERAIAPSREIDGQIQAVIEQIEIVSPRDASLISATPATLEQIQGQLSADTTLVSYFTTSETLFAFVITPDELRATEIDLSAVAVADLVADVRRTVVGNPNAPLNTVIMEQASATLIAPLLPLTTPKLIVVPHQQLHFLPFAALYDGTNWLDERYALSYLPSASALLYLEQNDERRSADQPLLALGNPIPARPLTDLPGAEAEAEAIAELFNVTAFTGRDATETVFRNDAPQSNVLHLAAHGSYNNFAPLLSTVYLAADEVHDGFLEAHEVYGLDLSAELVVLSACETQVSDNISKGDEITALNRAFLYAGTEGVIATLWQVDDASSRLLMTTFYEIVANERVDFATALQRAQAAVRVSYPHPYYWAGYTLTTKP